MSNTTSNQGLGERIEQLVQQHIEASRRAAQQAVERAFASAVSGPARPRSRPRPKPASDKRRTPDEIAALGERFFQAVCAKPGETMIVLAADVGAAPGELNRPMTQLKRAGRVRTAGARNHTRYFPMMSGETAAS
jgi:hypothetical protein